MKLMKYRVLVCFLCIINTYLSSQVSTDQIVFFKDPHINTLSGQKLADDIFSIRYTTPWVDRFEFRTETDRLMTSRQEFLFRTSFNSFRQKKADKSVLFQFTERIKAEQSSNQNELVNQRYYLTLEAISKQLQMNLDKERENYFLHLEKTYEAFISSGESFDLADYLKNHEELLSIRMRVSETKKELSSILFELGFPEQESVDIKDLISVDNMAVISSGASIDVNNHPELMEVDAKNAFLDAKLYSDKVKDGKILDFVQTRYSVRDDLLLENRFSVGIGLNFPWRGSSRTKNADIMIEKLETKSEKEIKKSEMFHKLKTLQNDFTLKKNLYDSFINPVENTTYNNIKKTILSSGRVSLTDRLSLEKYELHKAEKESELYLSILKTYIDIMAHCATLSSRPDINFFK
jgi:hypothetical protein